MSQTKRLPRGGSINRDKPINFSFAGKSYTGYEGDTLASALLANGVNLMARSFKYHRPRGVITSGSMEPNALVELHTGGQHEPNTRATMVQLVEGLTANSQNAWPSLKFDAMAINRYLSPFFVAGFYYKTFMWPGLKGWMQYEKIIRRAAGLGRAAQSSDPDSYQHNHLFCDMLIVGGGASGMTAALSAAEQGKQVIIVDEHPQFGGRLKQAIATEDQNTKTHLLTAIESHANINAMSQTTIFGAYDHGVFGALQVHSLTDQNQQSRQTYHKILANKVIYATGASERPVLFKNNDLPNVMLAEALQYYVIDKAVLPGKDIVFATFNDSVFELAIYLSTQTNAQVSIVDSRRECTLAKAASDAGVKIYLDSRIEAAKGWHQVSHAIISTRQNQQTIKADVIAMAGGFTPNVNLQCHLGNKPQYHADIDALIIEDKQGVTVGSAAGIWALADKITSAEQASSHTDFSELRHNSIGQDNRVELVQTQHKAFVDYQHDVSNKDVELASLEGYTSVEHTKRYTTLGMATDQGKLASFNALKIMSAYQQRPLNEVGTTTYRPPYTPISLGSLAGSKIGEQLRPLRRIPTDRLQRSVASYTDVGLWQRPEFYPSQAGESKAVAYKNEAKATRTSVGMIDVSTLGKIAVQGPDAAEFLNRLYINGMKKLGIGKIRYGLMLREDGVPYDDGTVMRLGDNEFLTTTTTALAADVLRHMEYHLQVVWRDLKVHVNTATDQWASIAVAGPNSRATLANLFGEVLDVSNEAMPFMTFKNVMLNGVKIRLARISFSGELGYEVMIGAKYAENLWQALLQAGKLFNITPYGTEAMGALRIEKGFITHAEMDGRVTLHQLGMGGMMSKLKSDFIGHYYANHRLTDNSGRPQLVGLQAVDKTDSFPPGYHLINSNSYEGEHQSQGWITATTWSVEIEQFVALGFLIDGNTRLGETVYATSPVDNKVIALSVVSPQFFDPKGERASG